MKFNTTNFAFIPLIACAMLHHTQAENIVFPAVSGVVDITKPPYSADNTGKTDCAGIFDLALANERSPNGWGVRCIYLPNGTYLVKRGFSWKLPPYTIGPHLYGQSRKGAVIRLADSTFRSTTQAGIVVQTGGGVAQNFCRGLFNVTINTGKGNPGAIGVFWYANNEGLMSDVDIISEDGLGVAGLRIGTVEEGPAMARRVYIKGFGYGVWSSADLNSVTLSQISMEGQRVCGVMHQAQSPIFIDSLTSVNRVAAVSNQSRAELTLINGYLTGGSPDTSAIVNAGAAMLFARNIVTQGYKAAITSTSNTVAPPTGTSIDEYSSHGCISQFSSPSHSLNLPIKRPPEPVWEQDLTKWADVSKYLTGRTDAAAFQAAIDDPGKTVVVFPNGRDYNIAGDVVVRGTVSMILSVGAQLTGNGTISIADAAGSPPVVKMMKLMCASGATVRIIDKSSRTVVLESIAMGGSGMGVVHQGSGDLFCTDMVNPMQVTNAQAHVWAWHYNAEGGTYQLDVQAGKVWIFGWKDEGSGSSASLTGGMTEILGFINYGGDATAPQFVISNASAFIATGVKCIYGGGYITLVRETRNGVTKNLLASANPGGFPTQFDLPAYSAYDATGAQASPVSAAHDAAALSMIAAAQTPFGILVQWKAPVMAPATLALVNSLGCPVKALRCQPGTQSVMIGTGDMPGGLYRLLLQSTSKQTARALAIMH
jgi:hypothetical protein